MIKNYLDYIPLNESIQRPSYQDELSTYELVKSGNLEAVKKAIEEHPFVEKDGWGKLSDDRKKNKLYHFIITSALIARVCIEGGLNIDEAYSISDYYIQRADKAYNSDEITKIHQQMFLEYTRRMQKIERVYSKPVSKCIDYIYSHLNENLTVEDIARFVGLNRFYLSSLFKKETHSTINDYINIKKIQTAENMLRYSNYTILEISNILGFSSQSYFSLLFKKYTNETPKKYANQFHEVLSRKEKK